MQRLCLIASPGPHPRGGEPDRGLTLSRKLAARFLVASLLAVIGAACAAPRDTSTSAISPSVVVTPVPSGTTQSLEIKQFAYSPATVEVAAGTVVEWKNTDSIIHSVTNGTPEQPGGAFDSGLFDEGQTFTLTLSQPGTYPYFCTRHQFMRGELRVSD